MANGTGVIELSGGRVLLAGADGPAINTRAALLDLIGEALGAGADRLAIAVDRLPATFFDLRTGLAGELAQAGVNYRVGLAFVGDIAGRLAASNALRDWVRECGRGDHVWFLPDIAALETRLAARQM